MSSYISSVYISKRWTKYNHYNLSLLITASNSNTLLCILSVYQKYWIQMNTEKGRINKRINGKTKEYTSQYVNLTIFTTLKDVNNKYE